MQSLKKLLIKKLAKEKEQQNNKAKIWQEKTRWGWNPKKRRNNYRKQKNYN